MTDWDDLPKDVLDVMKELGNFSPTIRKDEGLVKGYVLDSDTGDHVKAYFDAEDLTKISVACQHVANWLIERKKEANNV